MHAFCFTCERQRVREFVCHACGALECADCVDGMLCAECAFEVESWVELHAVVDAAPGS